jgi:hypothetical protein
MPRRAVALVRPLPSTCDCPRTTDVTEKMAFLTAGVTLTASRPMLAGMCRARASSASCPLACQPFCQQEHPRASRALR